MSLGLGGSGGFSRSGADRWAGSVGLGPIPDKIALFGDSRPASCHHSAPPAGVPVATITGLTVDDKSNRGFAAFLEALTGGRVQLRRSENWSAAGNTTTQMVARIDTAVAAIKAAGVASVIILATTNDRTGGISLATSQANCAIIEAKFLAAGIPVIWISETPRGTAALPAIRLTGTILQDHMAMRHWFNSRDNGRSVFAVDCWSALADPLVTTGDIAAGMSQDALHLEAPGNYRVAQRLAPLINLLHAPRDSMPISATDVWSAPNPRGIVTANPMMDGTTGVPGTGGSGQLATGWISDNAPAGTLVAAVYSKDTGDDGYPEQQIVLSGTSTADSFWTLARCNLTIAGNPAGITIGTILEAFGNIEVDPGATGLRALYLLISDGTLQTRSNGPTSSVNVLAPTDFYNGPTRTPNHPVSSGTTTLSVRLQAYMQAGVACSATIKLKRCGIRIVTP